MVRGTAKQVLARFCSRPACQMLIQTLGATANDEEIVHASGTLATVSRLANFGNFQGEGVDVVIGDGDLAICNSFDDRDVEALGGVPFTSV